MIGGGLGRRVADRRGGWLAEDLDAGELGAEFIDAGIGCVGVAEVSVVLVVRLHCNTPLYTITANPSRLALVAIAPARRERRAEQD